MTGAESLGAGSDLDTLDGVDFNQLLARIEEFKSFRQGVRKDFFQAHILSVPTRDPDYLRRRPQSVEQRYEITIFCPDESILAPCGLKYFFILGISQPEIANCRRAHGEMPADPDRHRGRYLCIYPYCSGFIVILSSKSDIFPSTQFQI